MGASYARCLISYRLDCPSLAGVGARAVRHGYQAVWPIGARRWGGARECACAMTVLILFGSTFAIVFAMGAQTLFISNGRYAAAFANSLLIGLLNLVLFKLVPASDSPEMAAFLLGGPLGVISAMYLFRHLQIRPGPGATHEPTPVSHHP
jgi:hypothetical protein